MIKIQIILLMLLCSSYSAISQSDNTDTIKLSQESAQKLKDDISLLNYNLTKLINANDSLKEFNEMLIENNYQLNNKLKASQFEGKLFEGILNEQTYRFLFLVLLLTILGTSISIYAVRDKGKELNNKFSSALEDVNKTFSKNSLKQLALERELFSSLANVNYNLARQQAHETNYLPALSYMLTSAMYLYRTVIDNEGVIVEGSSSIIIRLMSILTTAENYLDLVPKSEKGIERLRTVFPEMLISLEDMVKSEDSSINGRASELKRKLIELEKL